MPVYNFEARSVDGRVRKGDVDADSETEAKVKLRASQLIPISVTLKSSGMNIPGLKSKGIKPKELQTFTRQLAVLTGAGVPIVQGLEALNKGKASPENLRIALTGILAQLEQGKTLSGAMTSFGNIFDKIYTELVAAGEASGSLDTVLNRLAEYIEKSNKITGKVKGALVYPIVIMIVSAIVISVILMFVIPSFMDLFSASGQELPALTMFVVNLSEIFKSYWYIIFGVLIGGPLLLQSYANTSEGEKNMDSLLISLPVLGTLVLRSCIARFTRTLAILLTAGVRLAEAIEIAANTSGNYEMEKVLKQTKNSITQGRTFSEPLLSSKLIPEMVGQMISIGEESGNLDVMLNKIADFYEEEVEAAADTLTSLIEPFMMVFLGGIIAVLVIAMYLPIFNMANTVT